VRLRTEPLRSVEALETIRQSWRTLWRHGRTASIFQSPAWLIAWWRHFAPGELVCVVLWREDELVGFAPLYKEASSGRLLPLGISLSDYLDILIAEEGTGTLLRAMEAGMAHAAGGGEICLPDVAPDASVRLLNFGALAKSEAAGQVAPALVIGPAENLLQNVPPHQRQNLRTAENRAARRRCTVSDIEPRDLPLFTKELMRLHGARRQDMGEEGLQNDPRVLSFFIEAFSALAAEGLLRAYGLICDGRVVGGHIGFLHRQRASFYFGGFDPAFSFESPGTILIGHAIRRAAAEGAQIFDFLRGGEPYKHAWGAHECQLRSLSLVASAHATQLAS
jgi:CelD/BcsL family acetyltransferase involved in cellulose biosynthesis